MNRIAFNELQKAVYTIVQAGFDLMGTGLKLYDEVPDELDLPYCDLGDMECERDSTKTGGVGRLMITFNVWSRAKGKKEASDIINRILAIVSREQTIDLEGGFTCYASHLERAAIVTEQFEEGKLRHGVLQYVWIVMDSQAA